MNDKVFEGSKLGFLAYTSRGLAPSGSGYAFRSICSIIQALIVSYANRRTI
jgi:hypothetical protein